MVLGFGKHKSSSDTGTYKSKLDKVTAELEALKEVNARLQDQLKASGQSIGEYMYEYQSCQQSEWELKYIMLSGTAIRIYKSSKDIMFNPEEELSIDGCSLEWEGLRGGSYWAFSIINHAGVLVVRLAALSGGVAMKWVDMLASVGCTQDIGSGSEAGSDVSSSSSLRGMVRRNSFEGMPVPSAHSSMGNSRETSLHRSASLLSDVRTSRHASPKVSDIAQSPKKRTGKPLNKAETEPSKQPSSPKKVPVPKVPTDRPAKATDKLEGSRTATGEANPVPSTAAVKREAQLPMSGSTPVHTSFKSSYLSSDRLWYEKYTGLYNLSIILLVVSNFRLALENLLLYGWRYNPLALLPGLTVTNPNLLLAACYPILLLNIVISLGMEHLGLTLLTQELKWEEGIKKKTEAAELDKDMRRKMFAMASRNEWLLVISHFINTTAVLVIPCVVIGRTKAEPIPAAVLLQVATVLWMKLISYHHCNWDLRQARRGGLVRGLGKTPKSGTLRPGERGAATTNPETNTWTLLKYPENLSIKNLASFLAAPTLVYQVNYPRTKKIRWGFLARCLAELLFMITLMTLVVKQFVEPVLNSALGPFAEMNWPRLVERVLRLALPSTLVWLCFFYCLFHLWLNILAELTCFADREFYKDWWNASTLGEYWRLWNMPVHKWLLRHVYYPAIRFGCPRYYAMVLTFFVSAVFHELLIGVPLHLVRYWVFIGMMMQIPLVAMTEIVRKKLKRDDLGNVLFWLSFCILGQPVCILMYTHDFLFMNGLKEISV